ncbi:SRPBCC family protein [Rhodococcus opacus]|uniref:SRPBCC family protein n=1 Tax=Rhodococcus opacus TaxID=37919 RepID=UPI001C458515|nr:SRPBCC family protein [Rhodococcus opacus]MBV6755007.1 SRPBCC family protein [Rhodococcus opacus]
MTSIRSHAILDHDAASVWAVVRDVGSVADWFPAMANSEPTGSGRRVTLADGATLVESTVTLDEDLRRFQYRVVGGDLGVDSHLGTIDVIDLGDGRSVLVYGSDVEPAEVAEAFDAAIGEAVDGLNSYLATRHTTSA